MFSWKLPRRKHFAALLTLAVSLACSWQARAQPALVSVVPADGAIGVPTTTTVVFTFNIEMDPDFTDATFIDLFNPTAPIPTTSSWSANNKVLTCTPVPSFPANKSIFWAVSGQSAAGDSFDMDPFGSFTTSTGGSSGSGTNAIPRPTLGITHAYDQASTALPTIDATVPYSFGAITSLASNRTATNVQLTLPTLPTASISNLTRSFFQLEN